MPTSHKAPHDTDPADAKLEMRRNAAALRKQLAADFPGADAELAGHADAIIKLAGGGVVAGYLPIRSELSPLPLIAALAGCGVVTALPITPPAGNPLVFHQWATDDALQNGPYGTCQPLPNLPVVVPRLVLTPMLAFDDAARRLGYGGGFYDRTLAGIRAGGQAVTAIGIAFDGQQVPSVPTGPYDMPLDGVLTPTGLRLMEMR